VVVIDLSVIFGLAGMKLHVCHHPWLQRSNACSMTSTAHISQPQLNAERLLEEESTKNAQLQIEIAQLQVSHAGLLR
jgi:hypothetical protein